MSRRLQWGFHHRLLRSRAEWIVPLNHSINEIPLASSYTTRDLRVLTTFLRNDISTTLTHWLTLAIGIKGTEKLKFNSSVPFITTPSPLSPFLRPLYHLYQINKTVPVFSGPIFCAIFVVATGRDWHICCYIIGMSYLFRCKHDRFENI